MTQYMQEAGAMKQADEQREAFEAWADDQGFPLKRLDTSDGYLDLRTHGAWDAWQAALAASLPPAAVQAGWKLVPIEPTPEMIEAIVIRFAFSPEQEDRDMAREAYSAMLAAVDEGTLTADQTIYEPRLRTVLDVVQRYLPPDGIDAKTAMGEIIAVVDPWPGTVAAGEQRGDGVPGTRSPLRELTANDCPSCHEPHPRHHPNCTRGVQEVGRG